MDSVKDIDPIVDVVVRLLWLHVRDISAFFCFPRALECGGDVWSSLMHAYAGLGGRAVEREETGVAIAIFNSREDVYGKKACARDGPAEACRPRWKHFQPGEADGARDMKMLVRFKNCSWKESGS